MAHKYVVGLDIGTTGAKGAVIRLDGKVVSEAYREYICEYPRPNWVEQDVDLIVGKALECCREAVGKVGAGPLRDRLPGDLGAALLRRVRRRPGRCWCGP